MEYAMQSTQSSPDIRYQLRYQSLKQEGGALAFPCDAQGHVELNDLSERARNDYLFARAVVGFHFARPAVVENPISFS